mmetsp:Transcript_4723/g.17862  ORF Transcript_4723/g.17862 Transcript_4723/m.17862 type:complete len:253 (-) Transcript_4723:259-1017(-)|eukprot:CAMPEP_0204142394 /NCGR_PEP_ID=MMETSP0361-20130328/19962_1 /ASSEMBLY_ACC=CAM_ASM_000343 /TAXON_ID=268821 /ORGANISM="Scrippsiella Hangoei, Strain SHTV-5" /LENGTH=252 /DNA_ID=CAMNT_0051096217 /DNA_START=26 /DNA_END=784 /DNA_ORIENTATION=-
MEDVRTFEITRDDGAGCGLHMGLLSCTIPGFETQIVTVSGVAAGGSASRAGIGDGHVGWHIVQVDGHHVDASTCDAALDNTRGPLKTFTLTLRRPQTGEITVGSVDLETNLGQVARFQAPQDIDSASGEMQGSMAISSELVQAFDDDNVLEGVMQHLGQLRTQLTAEQAAEVAEEERSAGDRDIDAVNDQSRCVICLNMERAIVLLPCRHLATCHRCTVLLRRVGKCPMCRRTIDDIQSASEVPSGDMVFLA